MQTGSTGVETISQILAEIRTTAVNVWDQSLVGVTIGQLILALLILIVAVLVRRLFGYLVLSQIRFWSKRTRSVLDDTIVESLAAPLRFVPIFIAIFFVSEILDGSPKAKEFLAHFNRSLIAFVLFWALFEIAAPVCSLLNGRTALLSEAMIGWSVRVVKILIVSLGCSAILEIWGIHVGPFLAGLGLVGVAVALGAQDLFKNLIAGIFIIGEQRFQNGDWIAVDGIVEGTIEIIGLRTTKVRRFDLSPVFVPNSKLADNALTNFSQMTYRRISWTISLEYRTTVSQLRQIRDGIENYIVGKEDFVQSPQAPIFVRIASLSDSSIDIMIYCFTRTTEWGEWLKIKETLTYAIKDLVQKTGTNFAFPSRSLYVETIPAVTELHPFLHTDPTVQSGCVIPQASDDTTSQNMAADQ